MLENICKVHIDELSLHMSIGNPLRAAARSLFLSGGEVLALPLRVGGRNLLQHIKLPA